MIMKVYNKRGNISLKEKAMVKELEKYVQLEVAKDPNFIFEPANNQVELETLYQKHAFQEVEFEESPVEEVVKEAKETPTSKKPTESKGGDVGNKQIDPFNREEPIIRDYVMSDDFAEDVVPNTEKTQFDEPLSFDESFVIPEESEQGQGGGKKIKARETQQEKGQEQEPMNPAYSEMDSAKQRKRTKRFAKQIVELTTTLIQVGFVWYTSKDITEAKLMEYELNGEMDLSLLLAMPDGQSKSVRDFFVEQLGVIQQESEIDQDDKDDLTEALTEVFLEKGIAPTPTQELMLVVARVVGVKTLSGYAIMQSNASILNQLRSMKKEETEYEEEPEPTPQPQRRQAPVEKEPEEDNTFFDNYQDQNPIQNTILADDNEVMFPITKTKE
jgi:hypothetical protein